MQTYSNTDIQRIVGLKKNQITHLVDTGVVTPYQDESGRGGRRVFSWQNLVEFMVCKQLFSYNFDRRIMAPIINFLQEERYDVVNHTENKNRGLVVKPEKIGEKMDFWTKVKKHGVRGLKNPFLFINPDPRGGYWFGLYPVDDIKRLISVRDVYSFLLIDLSKIVVEARLHL